MIKLLLALLLIPNILWAAPPTRQNTYTTQTTIRSADVSANENVIFSYLQNGVDTFSDGSIIGADIANSAAIGYSKLNLANSIVNADISSSAAIVASKLDLTSPGAIGSTAAGTGAFTTLSGTNLTGTTLFTTGNIGVGTSTASGGRLMVQGGNVGIGTVNANQVLTVAGKVYSTTGGIQFPDNTVQTTASASGVAFTSATTITSGTTSGNIAITNTKHYKVRGRLWFDSTTDDYFGIQFNAVTTADKSYVFRGYNDAGTAHDGQGSENSASIIIMASSDAQGGSGNSNQQVDFEFEIFPQALNTSAQYCAEYIHGRITYVDSAAQLFTLGTFGGRQPFSNVEATSFRIISVGGNAFTGNIYLYEMLQS